MIPRSIGLGAALLLGAATVFGFAPFGLSALPVLTLAGLFWLWQRATPRAAASFGFAFGIGLFGAGASWVYVALSLFGGMAGVLAAIATVVFCAYLALFPALAGWTAARVTAGDDALRLAASAACWTLTEWLRSWMFTGFPWLSVGYAHVQAPLAGYAPLGGVFLVGLAVAASAALAVQIATALEARRQRAALAASVALVAIWAAGFGLRAIDWSHPVREPLSVSLVQGNVEQDVKFERAHREATLTVYAALAAEAKGRLIVLPESALPMFADEVPSEYVARLRDEAQKRGGDLLLGLFLAEPGERGEQDRYYNSVVTVGQAPLQVYRKRHLVPFGESIPLKPVTGWFINRVLHIPIADQTAGPADQAPFAVAGERLAVNICYEDAFGSELAREAAEATLLVNVTNDAWYGRSLAAEQHEQIAAMRAVETARPMLRATNTGITSIIDHRGREVARLPWFTRGILEGKIAGREGATPYLRLRDAPPVAIALVVIAICFARRRSLLGR